MDAVMEPLHNEPTALNGEPSNHNSTYCVGAEGAVAKGFGKTAVPKAAGVEVGAPKPVNMPAEAVAPNGAAAAGAWATAAGPNVNPVPAGALVGGAPNAKPVAAAGAGGTVVAPKVAGAPNVNPTFAAAGAGAATAEVVVDTPKLKPAKPEDAGAAGAPKPKFMTNARLP
jgi:hypothetical protein